MKHLFMLVTSLIWVAITAQAAHANIVVLGDLTRKYQLMPGQTHESIIELENRDSQDKKVMIYQTDYKYLASGDISFPPPGTCNRSNASWLIFSPKVVELTAGQKTQVKFLIRAPRDSSRTGTYWSMLMVQNMEKGIPEKVENAALQPFPASRYGVQIITQMGNTGKIAVEFTSATVVNHNAKRYLVVDIENKGTRYATPELWLEVFTIDGQKAGRFISDSAGILPGCGIRREIDISSLPKGMYSSLLIADCGHKDVFGLDLKLVLQ